MLAAVLIAVDDGSLGTASIVVVVVRVVMVVEGYWVAMPTGCGMGYVMVVKLEQWCWRRWALTKGIIPFSFPETTPKCIKNSTCNRLV